MLVIAALMHPCLISMANGTEWRESDLDLQLADGIATKQLLEGKIPMAKVDAT